MRAAASMLGVHASWISKAKSAGVPAFASNGTVHLEPLGRWIEEHREELEAEPESLKDQKLREQVIRLRRENDLEESRLVRSDWLRERFGRFVAEAHDIRVKALESHPHRFLAANGDVAHCRTILKGCWDENMRALQSCSHHFEEPAKT